MPPLAKPGTDAKRWSGGMKSGEARRLKELEDENRRLKRIVEDLQRQEQESGAVVVTRPARKTLDQS